MVRQWENKETIFPHNVKAKILGKDTLCPDLFDHQFKLLVYIDTTGCTPCQLRLYDWILFMQECKEISDNISFLFLSTQKIMLKYMNNK